MKTFLAIIGGVFVFMVIIGTIAPMDFHMYFGPDANPWHQKYCVR